MEYYATIMRNYANFEGRARREEYWMFQLTNIMIIVCLALIMAVIPYFVIGIGIYAFAVIIPSLSVKVRRLHDIGLSGWWILIGFIPYLGGFALFVMYCIDSVYGPNQYGENPKGIGMEGSSFNQF